MSRLCRVLPFFLLLWLAFSDAERSFAQDREVIEGHRWLGADGEVLPFETEEELLKFLAEAAVVTQKELTGGVNRPLKVRLEKDGIAANAIFRIVNIRHKRAKLDGKLVVDFHDSYIYECAAYQVSRLLGFDNIPPCVKRTLEFTEGTMQLWVEGATTEKNRKDSGSKPPDQMAWLRQKQKMLLLDAVIYNFDRNQGNMLIDADWKLWFIDHTRSFKKSPLIEKMEKIIWCDRSTWARLQSLDKRTLSVLKPYLTPMQINMTLKRRDKVVDYLKGRIERMGEGAVLYDSSRPLEISDSELAQLVNEDEIPRESSILEEPR